MNRPFPIRYEESPANTLAIEGVMGPVRPGRSTDQAVQIIGELLDFAGRGGFAGASVTPPESGLRVEGSTVERGRFRCTATDVRIDDRSLFVLENVLHFIHDQVAPLRDVVISFGGAVPTAGMNAAEEFPGPPQKPPFELEMESERAEVDIDVEFSEEQPDDILEQLQEALGAWFCAAGNGAYADRKLPPSRVELALDDAPSLTPSRVVFPLARARCHPAAFDGLVNLLSAFHERSAAIASVRIV